MPRVEVDGLTINYDVQGHAGLHEDPETFNRATLDFLLRCRS
jgi:pimeloyl-ACP methyl ester carboxylesterase